MLVKYTVEVNNDHIQVGQNENGQYTAISVMTGLRASNVNPLAAITAVIGSIASQADRRELLREVADRV